MTRKEIYEELKADGAKLKSLRSYNLAQLQELYTERFGYAPDEKPDEDNSSSIVEEEVSDTQDDDAGDTNDADDEDDSPDDVDDDPEPQVKIRTLEFDRSGWCEELGTSYFKGIHRPATVKEYLTLRKYAAREI